MKHVRMLTLLLALMLLLVGCGEKPLNTSVTKEAVQQVVQGSGSYILTKTDEEFRKLHGSVAFREQWRFDEWERCDTEPTAEEPAVSLCFAELYIVELYDNGQAAVYDGYASRGTQWCAYYTIPVSVVTDVKTYLAEHAELCGVGDANASTFRPVHVW